MKFSRFVYGKEFNEGVLYPLFLEAGFKEMAEKIKGCGDYIRSVKCLRCGNKEFSGFYRCKIRYCLNCAKVKSLLWFRRIYPLALKVKYLSLLTLTYPNMDDLEKMFKSVRERWRYIRSYKKYRAFWDLFEGYLYNIEIKKGSGSKKWHVHIHVLLFHNDFLEVYDIVKGIWGYGVDVRGLKDDDCKNRARVVLECLKYLLKPSYYEVDDLRVLVPLLRKKKTVGVCGRIFRGVSLDDDLDLSEEEEKNLADWVCQVCGYDKYQIEIELFQDYYNAYFKEDIEEKNVELG